MAAHYVLTRAAAAPPTGRRCDGALYQAALLEPILIGDQLQATGLPLLGFFQRSVQIVALDMELLSQKPSKLVEPVACGAGPTPRNG